MSESSFKKWERSQKQKSAEGIDEFKVTDKIGSGASKKGKVFKILKWFIPRLPKSPPQNSTFKCPRCGGVDSYQSKDTGYARAGVYWTRCKQDDSVMDHYQSTAYTHFNGYWKVRLRVALLVFKILIIYGFLSSLIFLWLWWKNGF